MAVPSHASIRKAKKILRASLTRIRQVGEANERQKQVVHDAFVLLGESTRPNDQYQKLLKEVQRYAGFEMVALCAISLASSRLNMNELISLLPPIIERLKPAWTCFALERLVGDQASKFPHLGLAAAPIKWVLMPRCVSPGVDDFVGYIDYNRRLFKVHLDYPFLDIDSFSDFQSYEQEPQTAVERYWWERSAVLDHGARGHVRQLDCYRNRFPVLKITGSDPFSRQLICKEFYNLKRFQSMGLPIVEVSDRPLKDEQGIIGFRMEKLSVIPAADNKLYLRRFKDAVARLHEANVVHGDLWFGNFMLGADGMVKLIDFSHSGLDGEPLPPFHRAWEQQDPAMSTSKTIDLQALENMETLLVRNGNHPILNAHC